MSGERHVYKELPREAKQLLDSKRLRYGFYRELSDGQEREIFRRVQLGKQLDKGGAWSSLPGARHSELTK